MSVGFSWQEYWSGLPFPSPGDLPDPGIKPSFPAAPTLAGGFFTMSHLGSPFDCPSTSMCLVRKHTHS